MSDKALASCKWMEEAGKAISSVKLNKEMFGSLSQCRHLNHQVYNIEFYDGGEWKSYGENGKISLFPDGIFHDRCCLKNASYHKPSDSITFSHGTGTDHNSGRLHFTDSGRAFVGTIHAASGTPLAVRGTRGYDEIFNTKRKPQKNGVQYEDWDNFEIKTSWKDQLIGAPELEVQYFLGDQDVSDRVRVTAVARQKGTTVLELVPSLSPGGDTDSFKITIAFGGKSFSGTYTSDTGTVYDWQGQLAEASHAALAEGLRLATPRVLPEAATLKLRPLAAVSESVVSESTLSLQDLNNISSIVEVTGKDGKTLTVDQAQTKAGEYYNKSMINGLDSKWIDELFGHKYVLHEGVNQVFNKHQSFFNNNSVLATGQLLYDNLATSSDASIKAVINKIKPEKLQISWENLGKNKDTAPEYVEVTNELYLQGYRDGVTGIQPYLKDDPAKWGEAYYKFLTDESNLSTWQIQIASQEFSNVKGRMYEWYTKLSILSPGTDYAQKMLSAAYSALLGVAYNKVQWNEDIKPFLKEVIEQAQNGSADFLDDLQKQSVQEQQEILREMISTADTLDNLVDAIAAALAINANRNANRTIVQAAGNPNLNAQVGANLPQQLQPAWNELSTGKKIKGVLGAIGYMAGAAYLLYTIGNNSGKTLTAKEIVEEVNMGILALGLFVKGVQTIFTLRVGTALQEWAVSGQQTGFKAFAEDLAKWFSKDGNVVPVGKVGKAFTKIFGENYTEFFARRLGPVFALFGIVLSSWFLIDAIKAGHMRDIVFESLNALFALADAVFIGLELFSVAWAGPVGLAVAVIGIVVMLVQFIWNLIDPPKPPASPIEQFVNGPMVAQGFAS